MHQPLASAYNDIYTNSFQSSLHLALLLCAAVLLIAARFASWILSTATRQNSTENQVFTRDCGMWLIGVITQQGWYTTPKSISLRCIFLAATVTTLICYIAYAAKIVSVLSSERMPIGNLSQLFQSSLTIYAGGDSITLQEFIKGLKGQISQKIVNVPLSLGVFLIFQGPSSLLSYSNRFHDERLKKNIPDQIACNIWAFPVTSAALPAAMGVPKQSPLREYFNHRYE